jgi:hypothetical protein
MNAAGQLWNFVECAIMSEQCTAKEDPTLDVAYSTFFGHIDLAGDPLVADLDGVFREPGIREPWRPCPLLDRQWICV